MNDFGGTARLIGVDGALLRARRSEWIDLLIDAAAENASVGFMMPIDRAAIERYWDTVAAMLDCRELVVLGLESAGRVVGTVQLAPCMKDNGRHRAELRKLLVASRVRRHGLGRVLLAAAEAHARHAGWWLLLLDTREASAAEGLYRNSGWIAAGSIPDYARDPDGRLAACTFFYKRLDGAIS